MACIASLKKQYQIETCAFDMVDGMVQTSHYLCKNIQRESHLNLRLCYGRLKCLGIEKAYLLFKFLPLHYHYHIYHLLWSVV